MTDFIVEILKSGEPFSVLVSIILLYVLLIKLATIEALLTKMKTKQSLCLKILLMQVDENIQKQVRADTYKEEEDD